MTANIQPNTLGTHNVARFLSAIGSFSHAYRAPVLSFIGRKQADHINLIKAKVLLSPLKTTLRESFASKSLVAGMIEIPGDLSQVLHGLLEKGELLTDDGMLRFGRLDTMSITTDVILHDKRGLDNQGRMTVFTAKLDAGAPLLISPDDDWELRASPTPYRDIQDLSNDYALDTISKDHQEIEVQALMPVAVDYGSPVSGTTATPTVRISDRLEVAKFSLGLRIEISGHPVRRLAITGEQFDWEPDSKNAGILVGRTTVPIVKGALLQAFATYDGVALHYGWLRDTSTFPNTRRLVFETFDPGLEETEKHLDPSLRKGHKGIADDFENAVANVLWMLGFSVTQVGAGNRTTDAVDIIAITPLGHYLAVECTIGLLKANSKLATLFKRASDLRASLSGSWSSPSRVLPVMVTALRKSEVLVELQEAERQGVRVITADDFRQLMESTVFPQDPDRLFTDIESYLTTQMKEP
ncbi:hypothetical protein GHV40_06520 [Devosia sp. D6-9]|nr:hypothetical protein GHV40_06520 [Devosia sp. D6-9]